MVVSGQSSIQGIGVPMAWRFGSGALRVNEGDMEVRVKEGARWCVVVVCLV